MKILITGGAGFIGSHLVDSCLNGRNEVIVIDDLSVGRLSNIEKHLGNPGFHFVQADVADFETIRSWFLGVDWVFHLAARADIVPSIKHPQIYHHANVNGTIGVLEAARVAKVRKLVYAASSSCYGVPKVFPTPEASPPAPQYPYALTKYVGEQYVQHWHRVYQLPTISLRFFNAYGPRARTSGTYGAVFGVFLAQKLHGRPLTVVGDGTQTRDFTYVDDIVNALVTAAESEISGEIFNVGSGGTYSINRLVELIGGDVTYIPKRPGEPDCTFAEISKIKKMLGWEPKIGFETGVSRLLNDLSPWKTAPIWTPESIATATEAWFHCLGR